MDGNSHRDNVKDAIEEVLSKFMRHQADIDQLKYDIADAVFDALGITDDEQDMVGGYFISSLHMLRSEAREKYLTCRKCGEDVINENVLYGVCEGCIRDDLDAIQNQGAVAMPETSEFVTTERKKELLEGAKYTKGEFKGHCISDKTPNGWYIRLETPICRYGQLYDKDMVEDEARMNFASYYYTVYCDDYERSTGKVD